MTVSNGTKIFFILALKTGEHVTDSLSWEGPAAALMHVNFPG